ncbi:hypothetical protein H8B06_08920 [Sphingobacterium sp. DN00404]|uniref:DUF4468 domain-containing protein n=1 Tax=Sphingobacterium micropteri TaxID=2763501 RepID=A0ABR7YNP2_9SPHI|nr:hypothetical protein [Sphingobacterium micropteri]MBD1432945.1 hypothetical protein [Sphingobacterium micropteri]
MTIKKIGIVLSLLMVALFSFSQTKLPSMTVKDINKSTAFEELIELLGDSDYFIQNMEKDVGFIQIKRIQKKKTGIFGKNTGDRIVYNILLREKEGGILLILQANVEKEVWNGQVNGSEYYYRDEGVSNDLNDYEELLKLIESHFENQ